MAASAKEVANLRKEIHNMKLAMREMALRLDSTMKITKGLIEHLRSKNVLVLDDQEESESVPVQSADSGANEGSSGSEQLGLFQAPSDRSNPE
jgi:hypothetical protein